MGQIRLGMLTPSSNTVLEPVSQAMLAGLPDASVHFARFRVTEISLRDEASAQFEQERLLDAARLLADAKVDVIAWNGTSSSWLGFDADRRLCAQITAETGRPATTAILALNEALSLGQASSLGLVTPYLAAVQERIVESYRQLGVACTAARCLGLTENFAFATVDDATLTTMVRDVAAARPDAVAVICTNLRAAPLAAAFEAEWDIPVFDTVATTLWKSLAIAGADPARVQGWGRLFQLPASPAAG